MRPLAATRVAASGCKWLQIMQMAASDAALEISNPTSRATGHVRPLAATCGHSSGCKWLQEWLQVAATTCKWLQMMQVTLLWKFQIQPATCGHVRPLAATCGHLRPLEWLQVAAFLNFKYRAFCDLNANSSNLHHASCMFSQSLSHLISGHSSHMLLHLMHLESIVTIDNS